ncbi:hypothetical protein MJD09_16215, partial [bacterium]|nr:hypothetical protein [bacterium]
YKLEVRIDSLVGFALPKVIEQTRGLQTRIIIPELPIRLGTVHPEHEGKNFADRSYKLDFYIRTRCGQNLFIEFKSDSGSRREKQDDYLLLAAKFKMKAIIEGILRISRVTSFKKKYAHLLKKLREVELIDESTALIDSEDIRIIYVQPKRLERDAGKEVIEYRQLAENIHRAFPDSQLMRRFSTSLENWTND